MLNWVDTHAHIYFEEMGKDISQVVEESQSLGVNKILLPSVDSASMNLIFPSNEKYPHSCFPMLGLHPCYVQASFENELHQLEQMLAKHTQQIVAIGEIGLDFYHSLDFKEEQFFAFETQLRWALTYHLPVSIHSRSATKEALAIVKKYPNLKGVFHCFGEDENLAKEIIGQGFYLGIGGVFTYPKNESLRQVIHILGLEHVVLETDSPYLSPVPLRNQKNQPAHIPIIGKAIAHHLGVSVDEVAAITSKNAKTLFSKIA